jgi:formamidopyrimidine-DNA glycosylase
MPESGEIRRMSECLNERLINLNCLGVMINERSKFYRDGILYSSNFLPTPKSQGVLGVGIGRRCLLISSFGKKIIFDFGDILMVSSCGMDGHWQYTDDKYCGIIIEFENGVFAFFSDSSRKGNFSITYRNSPETAHIFKEVGPDIQHDTTTFEVFDTAISNKRIKNKPICEFFMEQNRISGVGNWMRAEIMYESRIHPLRTLESLSLDDKQRLFYFTKTIAYNSYLKNGLTIATYRDPNGNEGKYERECYGKTVDRNGYAIETFIDKKERKVHWCPMVQF